MHKLLVRVLSRSFVACLLAVSVAFSASASAQTAAQNALNLSFGFNGPDVQFPYIDTFYAATTAFYQSIGDASMPGARYCHAYLSWDIAEQAVGSGPIGTEGSRSWFEDWLAHAQGHCDEALVTFKYISGITTLDTSAFPSTSDYEAAFVAFQNTDWSYTGWAGKFAFTPWNEPNNGAGSGDGLTTVLNAHLAADYYLAIRKHCDPASCTVAAGDFGSNGTLGKGYVQNCTDDVTSLCSTATYMDEYKYYLVNDAASYGLGTGTSFRPEIFAYHGWDDINDYINNVTNKQCLHATDQTCTAQILLASLSDPTWANTILWDSEVAAGQNPQTNPDPTMQACAASFLLRLTGTVSSKFQRIYYTQPYVKAGNYFSLFDSTGAEKPAFAVVADRNTAYEPSDGSICPDTTMPTTLKLTSSTNSPTYGVPVTITATLTPYSGTIVDQTPTISTDNEDVTFSIGSTTIGTGTLQSGVASITLSSLPAGSDSIVATYAGDSSFASTTGTLSQAVQPATLTITAPNMTRPYGTENPLLNGVYSGALNNDSFTVSGMTTATPASSAGTYAIVPAAAGSNLSDYTVVAIDGTLTITRTTSSVTLTAAPSPAAQGMPEVLTATVTGAGQLSGTVVFLSNSATLCNSPINASGVATCTFTPSASGLLSLSAQYQGDDNHVGSSAAAALNVYDTAISLQFANTQLTYPGATNVTACVTGSTRTTPTGTIQIADSGSVLATLKLAGNGCAYWHISPGLAAGTHSISAIYSGDSNNPPGASDPAIITVNPVPVRMSASCWNPSFAYGANYQCTVNVSSTAGAAQGSITYSYAGAAPVAAPLSNGNARFTVAQPAVGDQSVVIGYAQQTNYAAAASQTETFTVTPAPVNVSLTPSAYYAQVGSSITLTALVTSWSAGPPNATGTVSFYTGSTLLATVPVNSSGQASYSTSSLPAGTQSVSATYAGGTDYASGSASATITLTE